MNHEAKPYDPSSVLSREYSIIFYSHSFNTCKWKKVVCLPNNLSLVCSSPRIQNAKRTELVGGTGVFSSLWDCPVHKWSSVCRQDSKLLVSKKKRKKYQLSQQNKIFPLLFLTAHSLMIFLNIFYYNTLPIQSNINYVFDITLKQEITFLACSN